MKKFGLPVAEALREERRPQLAQSCAGNYHLPVFPKESRKAVEMKFQRSLPNCQRANKNPRQRSCPIFQNQSGGSAFQGPCILKIGRLVSTGLARIFPPRCYSLPTVYFHDLFQFILLNATPCPVARSWRALTRTALIRMDFSGHRIPAPCLI